jgi:hypothetical protein
VARRLGESPTVSRELHADCANCFGLCCVALPFAASADFAADKDAGVPCTHLRDDFGCGIHDRLREPLRAGRADCAPPFRRFCGASLRGARLIAADLRGADLCSADVIGADLRDADLSGADLRGALFLTQPQLDAARGDMATRLPPGLNRPVHWGQDTSPRRRGQSRGRA